ncbi:elongation factor G, partial [Pseudomonas syringae pv. tagetis]
GVTFTEGDKLMVRRPERLPAELHEVAHESRCNIVEAAAEASEEQMNKNHEGEDHTNEENKDALRQRTIDGEIVLPD